VSQISDIHNPWRDLIVSQPASFRGLVFHIETGSKISGRRTVLHEYPKRNEPYAEDMGRAARRFQFSGYLIYRPRKLNETNPILYDYVQQRKKLYDALEQDDAGILIHPVFASGSGIMVMCDRFSMTESREKGGYTQFEMSFVVAGTPVGSLGASVNSSGQVTKNAQAAETTALGLMPTDL